MTMRNWQALIDALNKPVCLCGAGGMGCDEDCPGDPVPDAYRRALIALLEAERERADRLL